MNCAAYVIEFRILFLAYPGCTLSPLKVILADAALKFSYSSSPTSLPSIVYAQSAPNSSTLNRCAPSPISSSGLNAMRILPCFISGCSFRYTMAWTISAMPALSSAPRSVCPSVTIKSSPMWLSSSGKYLGDVMMFCSGHRVMSLPS